MSEKKTYYIPCTYKNNVEALDTMIYIYSKTALKQELSSSEKVILREYILYGYSAKTKNSLLLTLFAKVPSEIKENADRVKAFNFVYKKTVKNIVDVVATVSKEKDSKKVAAYEEKYRKVKKSRATCNLNTLNCGLQKKGFLRPDSNNQRMKRLNDDLLNIKEVFMSGDYKKICLIDFKKNG
jgi:Na+/phosphate symporter